MILLRKYDIYCIRYERRESRTSGENPKPVNNGSDSLDEIATAPFEAKSGGRDEGSLLAICAPWEESHKREARHHKVNVTMYMK